jgi:hypothetical protein
VGGIEGQIDKHFTVLVPGRETFNYADAEVFVAGVASSGNITGNPSRIG